MLRMENDERGEKKLKVNGRQFCVFSERTTNTHIMEFHVNKDVST